MPDIRMAVPMLNCTTISKPPQARSANRRIFEAMLVVGTLTGLVGLVSLAREVFAAALFGTGDAMDAFLIAYVMCRTISNVFGGAVPGSLAPTYILVRSRHGGPAARRFLSNALGFYAVFLGVGVAGLTFAGPALLRMFASNFSPEKFATVEQLFYTLLPAMFINSLTLFYYPVINANNRFAVPAATPMVTPAVCLVALACFGWNGRIIILARGTVVGAVLELCLVVIAAGRLRLITWPSWRGLDGCLRHAVRDYFSVLVAVLLLSGTTLVDQIIAATLPPGSVSALGYANRGILVVLVLAGSALRTALLPSFSAMIAVGDLQGLRHTLKTYVRIGLLGSVALTAVIIVFGTFIVRVLFQRGAFTADDTRLVAQVQAAYAFQIPAFVLNCIMGSVISAFRANPLFVINSGINLALCIALDYLLSRYFGLVGIAIATAVMYALSYVFLSTCCYGLIRKAERHNAT